MPLSNPSSNVIHNWFWEGNVQSVVVQYLATQGYKIRSVADTASRQPGKDIIAEKDGTPLWVSVKGYPKGTDKTHPSTQAGHWFKQVIFDIIEYRGESDDTELAVAIPELPRYRSLAERISWFKLAANFVNFWVQESGEIIIEYCVKVNILLLVVWFSTNNAIKGVNETYFLEHCQ